MLAVICCGLIFAVTGCGGSGGTRSDSGNGIGSSDPVKQTIESYFNAYYDTQKSSSTASMNGLLADTDNIRLNEDFRSIEIEGKKLLQTWISDYRYQIKYKNVNITADTAAIDLILDLDYRSTNSPNVQSGTYNVNYRFTLKKDGSKWVITGIDSDLDEFKMFKDQVGQSGVTNTLSSSGQADAILKVKNKIISQFREVAQSIDQNGSVTSQSSNSSNNTVTVNSIYNVYYNYSPAAAAAYAKKYATESTSNRLFYTAYKDGHELDCTNFASQCVWAGYGGYVAGNLTQTKSNIMNKVRMTENDWYGRIGGGATNWENVRAFFNYMVSSKTFGPQGKSEYSSGDNNPHLYYNISPASINVGDVIQFWADGKYCHSTIVSEKNGNSWDKIKVCYHTSDNLDKNITEMFGWTPYIRRLTPLSQRQFEK
jgi:hypothetical protein